MSSEKTNKQKMLEYFFLIFGTVVFVLTWVFEVAVIPIYILILLGIIAFPLMGIMPGLLKDVPNHTRQVIVITFIVYLGLAFLSLSKFKEEVADWSLDVNMLGVGVTLVSLAIGLLNTPYERQEKGGSTSQEGSDVKTSDKNTEITKDLPSIDIVLNEARRALDFQFEQLNSLDTKSGIVLGTVGVIITLFASALINMPVLSDSCAIIIVVVTISIMLFTSLLLSYINLRISKWHKPPDLEVLIKEYASKDPYKTKCKIIGTMNKAIKENEELRQRRIYLYKWSYNILFAGLVIIAVGIVKLILSNGV